jgi:hypothetical protein
MDGSADVRGLLDEAVTFYVDRPEAARRLRAQRHRLDEPLRVALVGRVKAGKSTLLNALVGERLAPTDAGECTRVVSWYRNGRIARVLLHRVDGARHVLPALRVDGSLRLDLGGTPPAEVDRLVVDWPAATLRGMTLVDTPGTASLTVDASARTRAFVADDEAVGPDALVFLTRQVQPEDVAVLAAFRAATGGAGLHTTTILVLSRADEIGSARLDAMIAAEDVALRTAEEPAVRAMGTTVVPVAGLLGLAGRTLRQREFVALRSLALADRTDVDSMLLSADRFRRAEVPVPLSGAMRVSLLERFGLFGIRLSIALIRTGVGSPDDLADELVRRSGLDHLRRLIDDRFMRRGATVRAGAALATVEQVLRRHPTPGDEVLWAQLERVRLGSHDLVELDLLARLHGPDSPLPRNTREAAARLLGAEGPGPAERLGLPRDAAEGDLRPAAVAAAATWRNRAGDPVAPRAEVDACEILVRTAEGLLHEFDGRTSPEGTPEPVA